MSNVTRLEHKRLDELLFSASVNLPMGHAWKVRSKLKRADHSDFPGGELASCLTPPAGDSALWGVTVSKPAGAAQAGWPADETVLCELAYYHGGAEAPGELRTNTFMVYIAGGGPDPSVRCSSEIVTRITDGTETLLLPHPGAGRGARAPSAQPLGA